MKRLAISRPRPTRGRDEPAVSFALRLLCWHDEQFRRGWQLAELPPLSAAELACLTESVKLLGWLCLHCDLVAKGGQL